MYTHPSADMIKKKMSKYLDVSWFWFEKPIIVCKDPRDLGYSYGNCIVSEGVGKKIINWPCVLNNYDNNHLLKLFKRVHA